MSDTGRRGSPLRSVPRFRGWMPLAFLGLLIFGLGARTRAVAHDAFLTEYNLRNLLLTTMPLALVALGQTNALLVGGFDISVGGARDALRRDGLVHDGGRARRGTSCSSERSPLVGVGLATGLLNATLDPRARPALDHRDARDAQHPAGGFAAPARPSGGHDQLGVRRTR